MSQEPALVIEPLESTHDRQGFQCGNDALDTYLKQQASQDIKRRICRVYVAVDPATPASILGFYTLSTSAIELSSLPESQARKLPKHPLPAALLGRLAISRSQQGTGLGRLLLANAIRRTLAVSDQIGIYAILVDAIDEDARGFYHHYGFVSLQSPGHRLFLPLKSI